MEWIKNMKYIIGLIFAILMTVFHAIRYFISVVLLNLVLIIWNLNTEEIISFKWGEYLSSMGMESEKFIDSFKRWIDFTIIYNNN
jgi:hypothetical protein